MWSRVATTAATVGLPALLSSAAVFGRTHTRYNDQHATKFSFSRSLLFCLLWVTRFDREDRRKNKEHTHIDPPQHRTPTAYVFSTHTHKHTLHTRRNEEGGKDDLHSSAQSGKHGGHTTKRTHTHERQQSSHRSVQHALQHPLRPPGLGVPPASAVFARPREKRLRGVRGTLGYEGDDDGARTVYFVLLYAQERESGGGARALREWKWNLLLLLPKDED